jgi:hypothetical protein
MRASILLLITLTPKLLSAVNALDDLEWLVSPYDPRDRINEQMLSFMFPVLNTFKVTKFIVGPITILVMNVKAFRYWSINVVPDNAMEPSTVFTLKRARATIFVITSVVAVPALAAVFHALIAHA